MLTGLSIKNKLWKFQLWMKLSISKFKTMCLKPEITFLLQNDKSKEDHIIDMWLNNDQNISPKISPWAKVKSSTVTQNLTYSTMQSTLLIFICYYCFLKIVLLLSSNYKIKTDHFWDSVSSYLMGIREDTSVRIQLLSFKGNNLLGSKLQSNHIRDCQEHKTKGCLGVPGEASDCCRNGKGKGKYLNKYFRWNAKKTVEKYLK